MVMSIYKSLIMRTPMLLLALLMSTVMICQAIESEPASEYHHDIIEASEQIVIEPGHDQLSYMHAIAILADEEVDFLNRTAKFRPKVRQLDEEDTESRLNVKIKISVDYDIIYENAKIRVFNKYISDLQKYALSSLETLSEEYGDLKSTVALADINLFGNYSIPTNYTKALKYYSRASLLADDPHSNFMLGFIYSTGLFGQVEMSQAKALLHYRLAAEKGHLKAIMCLGYRYYTGFTVTKSLQMALFYYSKLAEYSISYLKDGYIGTRNIYSYNVRVSDFAGGLYGEHASETRSTVKKRIDPITKDDSLFLEHDWSNELISRHNYEAHKAYNGYYTEPRDYDTAFKQASACLEVGMNTDIVKKALSFYMTSKEVLPDDAGFVKAKVASCAALLGHMYLRAEGCEQNIDESLKWLDVAFSLSKSKEAANDLGLLAEMGHGVSEEEDNLQVALNWFAKAKQKYTPGTYNFVRVALLKGLNNTPQNAKQLYEQLEEAAYKSNLEAIYLLATLQENGVIEGKIEDLAMLYRAFVEKVEPAITDLKWAFDNLLYERRDLALIGYAMAAEQGYETSQSSVAYLLYPSTGMSEELPIVPLEHYQSALNYYSRSSQQYNLDSANFLGDLYYKGFTGNSFEDELNNLQDHQVEPNYEKAANTYQEAANRKSAQALFNLGYLHEMGEGVLQDFYLSKRYYDLVLTLQPDSYIPVQISLWRLHLKLWWYKLMGIEVANGTRNDKTIKRTWKDWLNMYERMKEKGRKDLNEDIDQIINDKRRDYDEHDESYLIESDEITNGEEEGFELFFDVGILEDLIIPIIFLAVFVFFIFGRIRRRNNNNNNNNAGQGDAVDGAQNDEDADGDGEGNGNGDDNVQQPRPNFQFQFVFLPI